MTESTLLARFLAEEATVYVTNLILDAIDRRTSGAEYLTFNVFNLRLDFDEGTATIEDELDASAEEDVAIDALRAALIDRERSQ
jgi:hypothetical protein